MNASANAKWITTEFGIQMARKERNTLKHNDKIEISKEDFESLIGILKKALEDVNNVFERTETTNAITDLEEIERDTTVYGPIPIKKVVEGEMKILEEDPKESLKPKLISLQDIYKGINEYVEQVKRKLADKEIEIPDKYILKKVTFLNSKLICAREVSSKVETVLTDGKASLKKCFVNVKKWPENKKWLKQTFLNEETTMLIVFAKETMANHFEEHCSLHDNVIDKSSKCVRISSSNRLQDLVQQCTRSFVMIVALEDELTNIRGVLQIFGEGKLNSSVVIVSGNHDVQTYKLRNKDGMVFIETISGTNAVEYVLQRELLLAIKPLTDVLVYCYEQIIEDEDIYKPKLAVEAVKEFRHLLYFATDKALLNEIEGILDHIKPLFDDFLLEEEKPNFSKYLREKARSRLRNVTNVVYVFIKPGVFAVYYTSGISQEILQRLKDSCEHVIQHIRDQSIEYKPFTPFTYVGAKVGNRHCYATLGCFVQHQNQIYGITCGHVFSAGGCETVFINDQPLNSFEVISSVGGDISAIKIPTNMIRNCDTRFRDKQGRVVPCKLFEGNADTLVGKEVYIHGAATKTGKGVIVQNMYGYTDRFARHYILVEDVDDKEPFCGRGDSGAVVCADDDNGILAISLVKGRVECKSYSKSVRTYFSYFLQSGLKELEHAAESAFELFTADSKLLSTCNQAHSNFDVSPP